MQYIQVYCMICIRQVRGEENDKFVSPEEKFKIVSLDDKTSSTSIDHLICIECIEKLKPLVKEGKSKEKPVIVNTNNNEDITNRSNKSNVSANKTEKVLKCEICEIDHKIEKDSWANIFDESSCECFIL